MFRFLLIFSSLAAGFYAITLFTPFYRKELFPSILGLTAKLSGALLTLLGQDISVSDVFVYSPAFSVYIVRGCDAVEPVALFACAVVAFPSPWARRILGVTVGALLLVVLNEVRIVTLFLIGVYVPSLFGVMHVDVWQGVFIVVALAMWLVWIPWATRRQMAVTQASA